jgi:hypothetical protein
MTNRNWTWLQDGQSVWKLDARLFESGPSMRVYTSGASIEFALEHATLPGRSIPADTRGRISRDNGTWTITVEPGTGLGFSGKAPLRPWLRGDSGAVNCYRAVTGF